MDLQYIQEFITVAENDNLPTAADHLYISPSLLSLHIRKLEEELGYPLFDRTSRTLVLNSQGRVFLPYAKKILSVYLSYRGKVQQVPDSASSRLQIGLLGSLAQAITEKLVANFYKNNPDIRLYIKSRDDPMLLAQFLVSRECDFVFLYNAADHAHVEDIIVTPLFRDPIVAVVPDAHPLSGRTSVTVKDIRDESILMQNSDAKVLQVIHHFAEAQGEKLNISFAVNSHTMMADMLVMNSGIGLMPLTSAQELKKGCLSLLPIVPELSLEYSMMYIDKPSYSSAELRLLEYIHSQFPHCADRPPHPYTE